MPSYSRLYFITLISIIAILLLMLYGYRNIQLDDSYIFYSYAQNLASGNGYVFNIGEKVNATTSPLYTILLALGSVIFKFLKLPMLGLFISIICLFFFCFFLLRSFKTRETSIFPFVVPLVLLLNPLLFNSIGMETFLTIMLIMISLYFYIQNNLYVVSIFCSLAVLARPDAFIWIFVLVVYDFIRNARLPSIKNVIIFSLPIFTWLIVNYLYFGEILPSTLTVKLNQTQSGRWGSGLIFLKGFFSKDIWQGNPLIRDIIFLAAVPGLIILVAKFKKWDLFMHPALHLLLLWNLVYLLVYGLLLNPPAYLWYYTPLSIGITLLISLPIEFLYRFLHNKSRIEIISVLIIVILAIICIIRPLKLSFEPTKQYYEDYRSAAEWLNANTEKGASVGAIQIGVLRYYYKNGPVIDGLGLVTPGVSEHVRKRDFSWYINQYKPDYLMFNHPHRPLLEGMVESDWFHEDYILRTVIKIPENNVAIYQRINN